MQERRNSIANALELRLSCTNPSISYLTVLYIKSLQWYGQVFFFLLKYTKKEPHNFQVRVSYMVSFFSYNNSDL